MKNNSSLYIQGFESPISIKISKWKYGIFYFIILLFILFLFLFEYPVTVSCKIIIKDIIVSNDKIKRVDFNGIIFIDSDIAKNIAKNKVDEIKFCYYPDIEINGSITSLKLSSFNNQDIIKFSSTKIPYQLLLVVKSKKELLGRAEIILKKEKIVSIIKLKK